MWRAESNIVYRYEESLIDADCGYAVCHAAIFHATTILCTILRDKGYIETTEILTVIVYRCLMSRLVKY